MNRNFDPIADVHTLSKARRSLSDERLPFGECPVVPGVSFKFSEGWVDNFTSPEKVFHKVLPGVMDDDSRLRALRRCGVISGSSASPKVDPALGRKQPLFPFRYDSWGRFMRVGPTLTYCPTPSEALDLLNGKDIEIPDVPVHFESLMEDDYDLVLVVPSFNGESPDMSSIYWGDPFERAILESALEGVSFSTEKGLAFDTPVSAGQHQRAFSNLAQRLSEDASSYVAFGMVKPGGEEDTYALHSEGVRILPGRPGTDILRRVLPSLSEAWEARPLSRQRGLMPTSLYFAGRQIGVDPKDYSVEKSKELWGRWLTPGQEFGEAAMVDSDEAYDFNPDSPVSEWDNRSFVSLIRRVSVAWESQFFQVDEAGFEISEFMEDFLKDADMGSCAGSKYFFDNLSGVLECSTEQVLTRFSGIVSNILDFECRRQELSMGIGLPLGLAEPMPVSYEVPASSVARMEKSFHNRSQFITQSSETSLEGMRDASLTMDVVFPTGHEALRRGVRNVWDWARLPKSLHSSPEQKGKVANPSHPTVSYNDLRNYLKGLPLSNYVVSLYLETLDAGLKDDSLSLDGKVPELEWKIILEQVSRIKEAGKAGLIGENPAIGAAHILGRHPVPPSRSGVLRDLIHDFEDVKGLDIDSFRRGCSYRLGEQKDAAAVVERLLGWNRPDPSGVEQERNFVEVGPEIHKEVQRWFAEHPALLEDSSMNALVSKYGESDSKPLDLEGLKKSVSDSVFSLTPLSGEVPYEGSEPSFDIGEVISSWNALPTSVNPADDIKSFLTYCPYFESLGGINDFEEGDPILTDQRASCKKLFNFLGTENSWKDREKFVSLLEESIGAEPGSLDLSEEDKLSISEILEGRNLRKEAIVFRYESSRMLEKCARALDPFYKDAIIMRSTSYVAQVLDPRNLREISSMLRSGVPLPRLIEKSIDAEGKVEMKGVFAAVYKNLINLTEYDNFDKAYLSTVRAVNVSKQIGDTVKGSIQFKGIALDPRGSVSLGGLGGLYYDVLKTAFPDRMKDIKFGFSTELGSPEGLYSMKKNLVDLRMPDSIGKEEQSFLKALGDSGECQKPYRAKVDVKDVSLHYSGLQEKQPAIR